MSPEHHELIKEIAYHVYNVYREKLKSIGVASGNGCGIKTIRRRCANGAPVLSISSHETAIDDFNINLKKYFAAYYPAETDTNKVWVDELGFTLANRTLFNAPVVGQPTVADSRIVTFQPLPVDKRSMTFSTTAPKNKESKTMHSNLQHGIVAILQSQLEAEQAALRAASASTRTDLQTERAISHQIGVCFGLRTALTTAERLQQNKGE